MGNNIWEASSVSNTLFTLKKALSVFGADGDFSDLPAFSKGADNRTLKSWSTSDLPKVGEKIGFLPKLKSPIAASIFVTKGGVLKSSLTLNIARMAALHGIRTCVVGLDMQGDVSTSLGETIDDEASLEEALARVNSVKGLAQVYMGDATLDDVLRPTDLPTLFYIPETPELVALDQSLMNRNRREYWLRDQVVTPLKREFDLVLIDCSPNWNRLITNALVACDVLISPLECKINNFRNLTTFRALIQEFAQDMQTTFEHFFVPTRLIPSRKLSQEIRQWYAANLPRCAENAVRESIQGEESVAMRMSIPEYAPTSAAADEMRALLKEIWTAFKTAQPARSLEQNQTRHVSHAAPALNV
jgi:chromosome partitioning protein